MLDALSAVLGFAPSISSAVRSGRERRRGRALRTAVCVALLALPAISCTYAAEPAAPAATPPPAAPRPVTQKSIYEQRKRSAVRVVFCVAIGVNNLSFAAPIDGTVEFLHKTLAEDGLLFFELGMDVPAAGDGTVGKVAAGSPAARAGVRAGDRITNTAGAGVARGFDFHLALIGRASGDVIPLKLVRDGKPFETTIELGKMKARPAASIVRTAPGLKVEHYKGDWNRLPDFSNLKPVKSGVANSIGVGSHKGKDHFALRFTGYVKAPAEGTYRFYVTSDDGARVHIGGRVMANNDGLHAPRTRGGRPIQLAAGLHPITVIYFEKGHGETLKLTWAGPGFKSQEIPASALFRVSPPR